jgi:hypothetical protein
MRKFPRFSAVIFTVWLSHVKNSNSPIESGNLYMWGKGIEMGDIAWGGVGVDSFTLTFTHIKESKEQEKNISFKKLIPTSPMFPQEHFISFSRKNQNSTVMESLTTHN